LVGLFIVKILDILRGLFNGLSTLD